MAPSRRKTQPGRDPVQALLHVSILLRVDRTADALDHLFKTATRPELPRQWSRALKSLTRQLRRIVSFRAQAEALLAVGKRAEARAKLKVAQQALAKATGNLKVEFTGPSTAGTLDLWGFIADQADELLDQTRRRIYR